MRDNSRLILLISSMMNNIGTYSNNYVFFKHYNSLILDENDVKEAVEFGKKEKKSRYLFFDYKEDMMQETFSPFFDWMRKIYVEDYRGIMSIEELMDKCDIYPQFKDIFVSMIEYSVAKRREEPVFADISFEISKIRESIAKFFLYVSKDKNIVMFFNNINAANYGALEMLQKFLFEYSTERIGIIGVINEAYAVPAYTQILFNNFLKKIESKSWSYDWDRGNTNFGLVNRFENAHKEFTPISAECYEYIIKINNMLYTYSFEQAIYYLEMINQKIEQEKLVISDDNRYKLYELYALTTLEKGDINTTLLILGNYMNTENMPKIHQFAFNYIFALTQAMLLQLQMALKGVEVCKTIAAESGDDNLIFKSRYLECIVVNYNWSALFMVDFSIRVDEQFIEELKKHNYHNTIAYIYAYSYENDIAFVDKVAAGEEQLVYFWKGIDIGNRLKNSAFLQSAYMKNIMLYSAAGYHDIANRFYEYRLEVIKQENDKLMIAHSYNGMGFNNIIEERYDEADFLFGKALLIYSELYESEYIAETLYNKSTNCFLAGDYQGAYECMVLAIYTIKKLDLITIQMCNASKLYAIAGISCYFLGKVFISIEYLAEMERVMGHLLNVPEPDCTHWCEDLCFYYMFRGILAGNDNPQLALEYFNKAQEYQMNIKGNQFIIYEMLATEMSKTYRKLNMENEANAILENAIYYSEAMGYLKRASRLKALLNGVEERTSTFRHEFKGTSSYEIKKLVVFGNNKKKVESKERDISLLFKWQKTLRNQPKDERRLIATSISSIITMFNLDGGVFIKFINGRYYKEYCDTRYNYDDEAIHRIANFFEENPKCFVTNRVDKGFIIYQDLLEIFGTNNIAALIGIPLIDNSKVHSIFLGYVMVHRNFTANTALMTEDNLTLIRSVFEQFIVTYNKIIIDKEITKFNKKLSELSYKDNLTGLYNRQGFVHKIESIIADNYITSNCLLYIDLDNFKLYNDVYGHAIGDKVLVTFSDILIRNVGNNGFAVRYGGDEFVVVIHDVSLDNIELMLNKIRLEAKNKVTDILLEFYKGNAQIQNGMSIEYSVGMTPFDIYSYEGLTEALRRADKALYFVKNNAKGECRLWNGEN